MSDTQGPIQLTSIEDSLVSEDGRSILLKCHAYDGKEFEIVIPSEALDNVARNLQLLTTSADIVRNTSDPVRVARVQFHEPEPTFYVTALGGKVHNETGLVQLRVGQALGPNFQLSMMKEQSQVLYNLLLEVFATDDEKPS